MITFLDGPASAATGLCLRRAPAFLRVVCSGNPPRFDALDQLADEPEANETCYAYRLVKREGAVHLRLAHGDSGFFQRATYRFVAEQPGDEVMRDNGLWRAWCLEQLGKGKDGAG